MATLNLHNPEGLYSGGSVSVNALPYARLAMEARARKQSREDAIDQYYQKLPDTLNDKGLRDQEIPIINEYKNKIFEFGLKNKEALRNPKLDNGAAQFTLQKMMREAHGVARESQNAAKTDLELGKLWFSKENQWALANDDFIKQHDQHNLPVTDPNYKKMDLANVMAQRPFDQNAFVKQLKTQFPYSEKITRTTDPDNPLYDIVTTKPTLDSKTKMGIYDFAADKLHNDYTFANKIKKDLAGTGQLPRLQEISQEVFGKPIESDEDLAAAYTVSQMYSPPTKEKSQTDVGAVIDKRFKQQKIMEGIRQANRKELFGMREAAKAEGEAANDLWVESYIDRLTEDAAVSPMKGYDSNKNGQRIKEDRIQLDPMLSKLLTKDGVSPDQFAVQPNGQYRPIFYKRDKDGNILKEKGNPVVDEIASVPMSKEQFKLLLGGKAGVKQLNKEMAKPTKKIVVKKGELDDIN